MSLTGYTIPAGWTVMVCPPALHLNPEKYNDTLAFNPWRWKVSSSLLYRAFCKLWTKIKGGEVVKAPGITFPNGLHIQVTERQ
ncbi:Cytochrome p450 [Thalictrum thalictroides]|uniref:Cytochrome p450 n=1 Tax=Thalictrum thalictroides TaxID=46969 RepID=A0A7J6XBZ8_THATH|nr:Cytochrome p450 [Thalictrum thalictroides]